jgi:2-keto-4-pentenoate hydratase
MRIPLLFLVCTLLVLSAAEPPSSEMIRNAAENYLAKKPVAGLEKGFSIDDAYKAQDAFTKHLSKKMGKPAGYKIGLITKPNQERLGADGPVRGVLLERMLLPNGAKVSATYGLKPAVELDMGVYVKDAGINEAKTVSEIISHLSDLVCFIELVDTIAATNQPMDASVLVSLNVGARAGIIGEKAVMTPAIGEALPNMKLILMDEDGKTLAEVPKLDLQPLANIPMLAASLNKEGKRLKAGDFISLGSPAAPQSVRSGKTIQLRYENLPGGQLTARVQFEP